MTYLVRRFAHAALVLFAVSLAAFLFADLAPGDFFLEMRTDPRTTPETIAGMRSGAGLDRPFPLRYAAWAGAALRGDFGRSLSYNAPVWPLVRERMGATLLLAAAASLAAWLPGVPLGIALAARRGQPLDRLARFPLSLLLAAPDLLLALAALVFAVHSGWFPAGGMASPAYASLSAADKARDLARHLALPCLVLAAGLLPAIVRHVRAAMIETLDSPFALQARALGIPRRRLLLRHLLPAAAHPIVPLLGFSVGTLLSGSLLVEVAMGWPGLGPLFLEAVTARDFPVVMAVVMLSAAFLAAGNLAADLLLYRLDPRIRVE